jgi:hypothetical protein
MLPTPRLIISDPNRHQAQPKEQSATVELISLIKFITINSFICVQFIS